jgi:hypothetical protein
MRIAAEEGARSESRRSAGAIYGRRDERVARRTERNPGWYRMDSADPVGRQRSMRGFPGCGGVVFGRAEKVSPSTGANDGSSPRDVTQAALP